MHVLDFEVNACGETLDFKETIHDYVPSVLNNVARTRILIYRVTAYLQKLHEDQPIDPEFSQSGVVRLYFAWSVQ